MKKIVLIAMFMVGSIGSVQAASIDTQTDGRNGAYTGSMHEIIGYGSEDTFQADSSGGGSTVTYTDNAPGVCVGCDNSLHTGGMVAGFIHDYEFNNVKDTWVSINSISETSNSSPGNFIDLLVIEVWEILAAGDALVDSATLMDDGGARTASLNILFESGHNYVIRVSNEFNASGGAGTLGTNPDYSLEMVSAIPVPAAVWLFGTALLGLLGFGRKSAKASAA